MENKLKPKVEPGDRIVCYYMENELSVPPGTEGTVIRVGHDPFVPNEFLIQVDWDNGSNLAIVSETDFWKKIEKKSIKETTDPMVWLSENEDMLEYFDYKFLRRFLEKIRDSGIVNMFAAFPLLYAGREHIDRYYGEGREDDLEFQEVLEDAEEAKHKIIQGVLSFMEAKNLDLDNLDMVNNYARKFSRKILEMYIRLKS